MKEGLKIGMPIPEGTQGSPRELSGFEMCALHSVSAEKLTQAFGIIGSLCDAVMKIATTTGKGHIDIDFDMDFSRATIAAWVPMTDGKSCSNPEYQVPQQADDRE